ncbi:DNA repair protein RadA [Phytoactinopolyspora alkaliphila]|uniref:DNA repair protein RadA n=1 Tax=Phytoactinopolyspora alkaliphila TaxID=1783498 RepID=A0A6N9YHP7_9ACTN|nr:DNA repair protein RadA [Phytoactinopolyspora alkaliphila]NED94581.1 DNA repair protein RadA [Phytoactinopolyspora alkaliphila]
MTKAPQVFRCAECGWNTSKWVGRCGECQAWGTVDEAAPARPGTTAAGPVNQSAKPIGSVGLEAARSRPTGVEEFDRALGGGLVQGAVILLAGEPGVGKSTLLLDVTARWAIDAGRALYVTGEESTAQVRLRAERTGALADHLYLAAETDLAAVLTHIDEVKPSLVVLDSVQTVASPSLDNPVGGVNQVREVAASLIRVAKERGIATILVGHVTKDGSIAGPRVLEHLVDVVLHFEGDRNSRLRMVRTVKNRYGPADEVGCFDLSDTGIQSLPDPTGLFLSRHAEPVPGTCITVTVEGRRPLLGEVQALVAPSALNSPRRANSGLDAARVSMVLAVLERRGRVQLSTRDVYTSTVGGARLAEPATDLAVLIAVASAAAQQATPMGMIALGEVGLAGEIRRVAGMQRRLAEAERMGFTSALVPPDSGPVPPGIRAVEVDHVGAALAVVADPASAFPIT